MELFNEKDEMFTSKMDMSGGQYEIMRALSPNEKVLAKRFRTGSETWISCKELTSKEYYVKYGFVPICNICTETLTIKQPKRN